MFLPFCRHFYLKNCLFCSHPTSILGFLMTRHIYCKFGNFRENFIFVNSTKRHICHIKNSWPGHDLPAPVNDRVILPFCEGFIFPKLCKCDAKFCENKTLRKYPYLQYHIRHIVEASWAIFLEFGTYHMLLKGIHSTHSLAVISICI